MLAELKYRLWTVEEFLRLAQEGRFGPDERVELIEGEISPMTPIGDNHAGFTNKANKVFSKFLDDKAIVSVQNPIQISNYSRPQPDIAILKYREDCYVGISPKAEDVLLLLEISDSTLRMDRRVKLPLYAKAGIPEYWILNLEDNVLEVYRYPQAGKYVETILLKASDTIALLAFPEIQVSVSQLIPKTS
jgi:Uma2 family endonuclease